jgi:hypothetical protein
LTISENHTRAGEVFGVICWLWIFHRARHDLPVVLGFRHPWEHAEDPFSPNVHTELEEKAAMKEGWDKFSGKAMIQMEVDDDDDDDEDEDE